MVGLVLDLYNNVMIAVNAEYCVHSLCLLCFGAGVPSMVTLLTSANKTTRKSKVRASRKFSKCRCCKINKNQDR